VYRHFIGGEDMFLWFLMGDLDVEIGREIIEAQDLTLQTKYYSKNVLHITQQMQNINNSMRKWRAS
jgi:hypothetical protein